jgi:tetratricopeptide (TPR) repeat protein
MNSSIFKTLKDTFVNASSQSNRSTVELCIIELSSGNFSKAVDLSEEIIKKDINDSVGWATKALSQSYLFDYQNNLFFLKSSLTSLDEFKSKTSLSTKEIMAVEAVFVTTILDRTITLVTERVNEVKELRRKAMAEKAKASVAAIGTIMSAYAGSQSKSNVGKVLGFGGAIAGVAATANFTSNSDQLNAASKGVFGVAIANISMTVGSAMVLKKNLNALDSAIRDEATTALKSWITTIAFLYRQVVENLLDYSAELKKQQVFNKLFRAAALNLRDSPEVIQFIYLSKILGIESSIPEFKEAEEHLLRLREIDENELKSSIDLMALISFGGIVLGFIIAAIFGKMIGVYILFIGILSFLYFLFKPLGKAGELKQSVNAFADAMENFKITSNEIIVENMKPQEKSLN